MTRSLKPSLRSASIVAQSGRRNRSGVAARRNRRRSCGRDGAARVAPRVRRGYACRLLPPRWLLHIERERRWPPRRACRRAPSRRWVGCCTAALGSLLPCQLRRPASNCFIHRNVIRSCTCLGTIEYTHYLHHMDICSIRKNYREIIFHA